MCSAAACDCSSTILLFGMSVPISQPPTLCGSWSQCSGVPRSAEHRYEEQMEAVADILLDSRPKEWLS